MKEGHLKNTMDDVNRCKHIARLSICPSVFTHTVNAIRRTVVDDTSPATTSARSRDTKRRQLARVVPPVPA